MTMGMLVRIPTWQEEVQLAPWVPGGQGSSQSAPLHPARQLQPPDFGSQNPPVKGEILQKVGEIWSEMTIVELRDFSLTVLTFAHLNAAKSVPLNVQLIEYMLDNSGILV